MHSALPEKYELDYLLYSLSDSPRDEDYNLDVPLDRLIKRLCFKAFDNWKEDQYMESQRNG